MNSGSPSFSKVSITSINLRSFDLVVICGLSFVATKSFDDLTT